MFFGSLRKLHKLFSQLYLYSLSFRHESDNLYKNLVFQLTALCDKQKIEKDILKTTIIRVILKSSEYDTKQGYAALPKEG